MPVVGKVYKVEFARYKIYRNQINSAMVKMGNMKMEYLIVFWSN